MPMTEGESKLTYAGMLIATTQEKKQGCLTLVFIFLRTALIQCFSKKQFKIETSVFRAEFVAMNIFMEILQGIRYKLRMTRVPISYPSYIYGDNISVIYNTQRPESTFKKKSYSIFYYTFHKSVAMGKIP